MDSTVTKHKETPGEKTLVVPSGGQCRKVLGTKMLVSAKLFYVADVTDRCVLWHARVFERNDG